MPSYRTRKKTSKSKIDIRQRCLNAQFIGVSLVIKRGQFRQTAKTASIPLPSGNGPICWICPECKRNRFVLHWNGWKQLYLCRDCKSKREAGAKNPEYHEVPRGNIAIVPFDPAMKEEYAKVIVDNSYVCSYQLQGLERIAHENGLLDELPPRFINHIKVYSRFGPLTGEELAVKERYDRLLSLIKTNMKVGDPVDPFGYDPFSDDKQ